MKINLIKRLTYGIVTLELIIIFIYFGLKWFNNIEMVINLLFIFMLPFVSLFILFKNLKKPKHQIEKEIEEDIERHSFSNSVLISLMASIVASAIVLWATDPFNIFKLFAALGSEISLYIIYLVIYNAENKLFNQ